MARKSGPVNLQSDHFPTSLATIFRDVFFWKFNFISDVELIYDPTVATVGLDEAEIALAKLRTFKCLQGVQEDELPHPTHTRTDNRLRTFAR